MEVMLTAVVFLAIGCSVGYLLARSQLGGLSQVNAQLVQTAENMFKHAQTAAQGDLDKQRLRIEHMVEPVKNNLDRLQESIQRSDSERRAEWGGLSEQMKQIAETNVAVQTEAAALKNVLRSSSSTRGRWGETQLRRVVELAGMLEYCDFAEQPSVTHEEGRSRADLLVYLPGQLHIAVDAKVPYTAYEKAVNTDDPELQRQHFIEHARLVKVAADGLAKRRYWEKYTPSPGFCLLFVPGDGSLQAALTHDPELWEWAAERHVLLTSPSTMITMLRLASVGWQQHRQGESSTEITKVGKDLYESISIVLGHVESLGKSINATVSSYSKVVGSLEHRVVPRSRRLKELGIDNGKPVVSLRELDERPREFRQATLQELEADAEAIDAIERSHN